MLTPSPPPVFSAGPPCLARTGPGRYRLAPAHLTMSNNPVSEPSEQPGWIELGWEDEADSERPPVLGAVLPTLAFVDGLARAIWLLATGQLG